jgi:hypothetical protein
MLEAIHTAHLRYIQFRKRLTSLICMSGFIGHTTAPADKFDGWRRVPTDGTHSACKVGFPFRRA